MNYISEINSTSLRNYIQLQHLDLGSQNVQLVIRNYAFLSQKKLTRLVLGDNKGLKLEPNAFAGLFNLKHLFLDHCNLKEPILAENFLQPLLSLETLDLSFNKIQRLQPGLFFSKLTEFKQLKLKLNQIERLCEEDLAGFRGKNFTLLDLHSNDLGRMYDGNFDVKSCGNPFRGMTFHTLDLSTNGINIHTLRQFFKAIQGTPIAHLISSGHIGKGFSYNNLPDPDERTFEGLVNSSVDVFDISKNCIFALERAVFSPLKTASIIDISKNSINQIKRNAFRNLQGHLKMLNLSYNLLGEIRSHNFNSLTELLVLDLSHNHIGMLGHDAFSGLPKLQFLYLTGNSLRNLGFPALLPNLEYLLLEDNKLTSLGGITKYGNCTYVDVSYNRLTNLEDFYIIMSNFKHLQKFFFTGNLVMWCTLNGNVAVPYENSLERLDLGASSLQIIWQSGKCLDLFDQLKSLLVLSLSFNSLSTLPEGIFRGLSSIIRMDLSYNALTYLQPNVFPDSLVELDLANNFLSTPDPTTFQSLLFLQMKGNGFLCDCNLESFLKWLNETNTTIVGPLDEYRCEFPAPLKDLPLLRYTTVVEPCEEDDEKAVQDIKFALFLLSALLILTVILSGIVYARLRGKIFIVYKKIVSRVLVGPKQAPAVEDTQYDVFFCFSNSDYWWVEAALLNKLDNQFSEENIFHCCFEARDFLPGEDHLSNIRDAIWGSRKTVCIISNEFLKGRTFFFYVYHWSNG